MASEMLMSDLQKRILRLDNRCKKCVEKQGIFACEPNCKATVSNNKEILKRRLTAERRGLKAMTCKRCKLVGSGPCTCQIKNPYISDSPKMSDNEKCRPEEEPNPDSVIWCVVCRENYRLCQKDKEIKALQDKIAELEGLSYSLDDLNIAMDIAFTHGQSWGQTIERIGAEHFKTKDQSERYAGMKKEVLERTKARK